MDVTYQSAEEEVQVQLTISCFVLERSPVSEERRKFLFSGRRPHIFPVAVETSCHVERRRLFPTFSFRLIHHHHPGSSSRPSSSFGRKKISSLSPLLWCRRVFSKSKNEVNTLNGCQLSRVGWCVRDEVGGVCSHPQPDDWITVMKVG